ncbi:helix-turn-helix domain-containing protein [Halocatena salina]|uniref:Helix-turn-helix domain-containing protein n=1 Tax=Halocatena salina TaxID=2934340 RepID=A0A8U0A5B1_9EURY|nr:helix-turn-helix domain-containing protein [Halocatena salina]UPM43658.1 helix-turn-helix domain-containing protein [Halocatena salina]
MISECLVVEFEIRGDDCPLAEATRRVDVPVTAQPPQLRSDGYALLRFGVSQAADRLTDVLEADDRVRYLHRVLIDSRTNYRCLSKHPCVVHELVSEGLLIESLGYRNGTATVRGAVVGYDVLEGVMDRAGQTVGVTLRRVYPLGSHEHEHERTAITQRWDLTRKQEQALRVAIELGYFELPRNADAAAVAAELGVSKSAFLERLRRAERAVLTQLFR